MPAPDHLAPLRIAQLVESLEVGGAERLAVQIAGARAASGDHSVLLVLDGPGPLAAQVDPRVTLRYLHIERGTVTRPFSFLASIRTGLRALDREIRRGELQVMQSHLPDANFWGLLLALRRRVAVIPTVHNNNEFHYSDRPPPRIRSRLRRLAYRLMLHRCAAMVAVSDQVAASLLREIGAGPRAARNLQVVANGVHEPPPLDPRQRQEIRDRHGSRTGELFILAAGRHSEQKNFQLLITAAARLRERGVAFRLVIAGDGELRGMHQELIAQHRLDDHVHLPGNLSDLAQVMQAADVFVLPSRWEGLPLVLLEAMAAGTPTVGSDIAGIREIVTDGQTGLLSRVDDADALAATLMRLQDPELRARIGQAGRELVRLRYAFARVNDQLGALYHQVVNAARRP